MEYEKCEDSIYTFMIHSCLSATGFVFFFFFPFSFSSPGVISLRARCLSVCLSLDTDFFFPLYAMLLESIDIHLMNLFFFFDLNFFFFFCHFDGSV